MQKISNKPFWIMLGVGGFFIILLGAFVVSIRGTSPFSMMGFSITSPTTVSSGESTGYAGNVSIGAPSMAGGYALDSTTTNYKSGSMPIPPVPTGGQTAATSPAKVIRNGNFVIEVDSVSDGAPKVADIAKTRGGYVDSSNINEDTAGNVTGYVTIRVPSDKFDDAMNDIRALAVRVSSESTTAQDVTEQYTDLEARLKAAEDEEAQYLTILKQANTVEDLLSVQQYLSQVRSTIESLQGQIQYLSNVTDYSTISVTLTEQASFEVPTAKFDLLKDIKQAGRTVILLAQAFITFAVWFLIIGAAIFIPLTLVGYVIYRIIRRIMRRV